MNTAVKLRGVHEKYQIRFIADGKISSEEVWALENIGLEVNKGDVLGVIGENGSGKTTLLKLIAGMLAPDRGIVEVGGRISAIMELGAGFHPESTGRENILVNASIYNIDKKTMDQRIHKIIEFADLGKFIDAPIKYYSQGMYMRLAFALAIFVEPDILLIDDILAVGDEEARQKCIKKIHELKESGKTIILVSHDMNMVSMLCNRAILLKKGRIIKDSLPAKTVAYYLETVGSKRGIAVLERGALRVVFNNGRIFINHNDSSLTKGAGGFVSFFAPAVNSWLSSCDLYWDISSVSPCEFVAEGRSCDNTLLQAWRIAVSDRELQWKMEMHSEGAGGSHIDLVLDSQYREWFTLDDAGNFANFANKSNWQVLGLKNCQAGILGIAAPAEAATLPNIIIERNGDKKVKLLNTGYDQEGRVIQWLMDSGQDFISIKIFPEKSEFDGYLHNARQQICLQEEKELAEIQNKSAAKSGNLRLFADAKTKSIKIFFKEKEITQFLGLQSSFCGVQGWFNSENAEWEIEKAGDDKLVLILSYRIPAVSQAWTLDCREGDNLGVEVKLKVYEPITLNKQYTNLILRDEYKGWLTADEEGNFSDKQFIGDIAPVRLKYNKTPAVVLKPPAGSDFPQLSFEASSDSDRQVLSIYRRNSSNSECTYLSFSPVISNKQELLAPGQYNYFSGNIKLGPDAAQPKKYHPHAAVVLSSDDLKLVFEQGRSRIFCRGEELTAGLGVYTSLRSAGIWFDSYQAVWQVHQEDRTIVAVGHWPHIPVSQLWQMAFVGKNTIFWKVDMEIYGELDLDIQQSNVMLVPDYNTWIARDKDEGSFPDEYTEGYDILPFRFWHGRAEKVSARAEILPTVVFKSSAKDSGLRAVIENTDSLYKARLFQYQSQSMRKAAAAGKYAYFEGSIEVEHKK